MRGQSVRSEQTFSVAKRVYDDNRSLLSLDKAEKLTFLNKNLPIIALTIESNSNCNDWVSSSWTLATTASEELL
jgi:hypothetical protein